MKRQWNDKIFEVSEADFGQLALELFRFQYANNPVYQSYVNALGVRVSAVEEAERIPFLPIRFFKSHRISTGNFEPATIFESSGTTGTINSRHFIRDLDLYRESFRRGFNQFYGDISDYCVIGLLPSYLERTNSSLVYMVNDLIAESGHPHSGFYLDEYEKLFSVLKELEQKRRKTLLIGVTFALLDFAAAFPQPLRHTIVMETGGMKGRRKEMIRQEVHDQLQRAFSLSSIHSEYGMTELLSQAYSRGNGIFYTPPWLKIVIRDEEDPFAIRIRVNDHSPSLSGAINIIDLANIDSCSFIATDDAGRIFADGSFEVLGRMDGSDLRGCSLLTV